MTAPTYLLGTRAAQAWLCKLASGFASGADLVRAAALRSRCAAVIAA